jgi:acetyl-CoA carboxylase carboxyltransferase component
MEKVFAEQGAAARDALVAERTEEWLAEAEPYEGAANLSFDDVIEPAQTRGVVARAIEVAWGLRENRVVREWAR